MSYILDALKKSEKKRRHSSIPEMLAVQDAAAYGPKRRALWPYMILIALAFNAGLLIWWLRPWQQEKARPAVQPAVKQEANAKIAGPAPAQPSPGTIRESRTVQPGGQAQKGTAEETSLPGERKQPPADSSSAPERPSKTGRSAGRPPKGTINTASGQKAPGINDLPPSVQQALPAITVSAHFYDSNPASRVVSINGRVMHEGGTVIAGLTVERITPDGVIFSYQGYRFHKGIF